jgi:hypothetical protein
MPQLHYLLFDPSDAEGRGTWDAMASVRPDQLPAVLAEVVAVRAWVAAHAPGPRGPFDEGGAWDEDHQVTREGDWVTVTLTLTGPIAWGDELMAAFLLADGV